MGQLSGVGIRHLSFTFGDQKVWYRDLPDVEQRIRELNIPDEEDLWNWGYCRRSSQEYEAQVASGCAEITAYLVAAGIRVDAVLACSPFQNSGDQFADALAARVLPRISTGGTPLRLVGTGECLNVVQALAEGCDLIRGDCEHVLILATEQVMDERHRFRKYSVFSDFSFALLLSSQVERCDYEVLDVKIRGDDDPGLDTSRILTRDLEKVCVADVLRDHDLVLEDVGKLFYLNLFEPIAEMKGKHTGFAAGQLYTELTKQTGHCYGADPFINMHSYFAAGGGGDLHVLCTSAREHAGVSLVRRLQPQPC